jgi:transcriptional regulator with XRE-family HTH domain
MKTAEYLDLVLKERAKGVNAQLARLLGVHRAAITNYQTGDRVMDDYTAARVAEVLGIDEIEVIAQANAEREKDPEKRAFWEEKAKTAREKREPLEVVASLGIEPRTRGFSMIVFEVAENVVDLAGIDEIDAWRQVRVPAHHFMSFPSSHFLH